MDYSYEGIKVLKCCSNCRNHSNYNCPIWEHEVVWCGSCKYHNLNIDNLDVEKFKIIKSDER